MAQVPSKTGPLLTTPSAACATPTCPPSSLVCAQPCKAGYECTLNVIEANCQCPIATCSKPGFDTGIDNGNNNKDKSSSKPSVVGPILGSLAGLAVMALITFLLLRRRKRRRRRTNSEMLLGQDDSVDSFSKSWRGSSGDLSGHKDVIRIAYIPSIIGDSPIQAPELAAHLGGAPQPSFMSSIHNDSLNKHDSIASTLSTGTLDEAVAMAVTAKATPQVMRLETINTDLIQRSNSLHSSNSIKRSTSQRRVAAANRTILRKNSSPLGQSRSPDIEDNEEEGESTAYSSSHHHNNPFSATSASSTAGSIASPSSYAYPTSSSQSPPSASTMGSMSLLPLSSTSEDMSISLSDLHAPVPRPWTGSGSSALRDSTFSTMSDARSSTRGDGEEIMIFWDGHRDSKASNL